MESRTDRYQELDIDNFQRSKKNADLYKEIYGNYDSFDNLPIPENTNEIDIENFKSLVESRSSKRKVQLENVDTFDDEIVMPAEEKVYDINTLLEKAKEENAKIMKDVPVNKNIPNYLANLESDKATKEIILKYDENVDDDLPIVKHVQYSTSEISFDGSKVNTSSLSLDILSDLKSTDNTKTIEIVNKDIEEEAEKEFYSGKLEFSNNDFEDKEEENDEFFEEDNHVFLKVLLIIIGVTALIVALYFILKEYTNIF